MAVKEQINHGHIQERYPLHKGILSFHLPALHFVNFTRSPPLCYSLKLKNYRTREKKIFCIYGCFSESRYIKGGRKSHL